MSSTGQLVSHQVETEEQMIALGQSIASSLAKPAVVLLSGDLGAG